MKITFCAIGKSHDTATADAVNDYTKRLQSYFKVDWKIFAPLKNSGSLQEAVLKKKEATLILDFLDTTDYLILLDERGKLISSEKLAQFITTRTNESCRHLIFFIGGAFGVDESVMQRANFIWSLSPLVFPHQLVRLILAEQVYRGCTIIKGEKYHHI